MSVLEVLRGKRMRLTKAQLVDELERVDARLSECEAAAARDGGRDGGIEGRQAFFEAVFEDLADAVVLTDADRRVVACNPALTGIFGYEPGEISGRKTEVLYSDRKEFRRQGRTRFNPEAPTRLTPYVVDYQRKSGEVFPGETVGASVRGDAGNTLGYVGIIRDVSERAAVEAAQARISGALENLAEGLALYDADDRLVYCNEKYRQLHPAIRDLMVPGARFEDLVRAHAERGAIPDAKGRVKAYVRKRMKQHRNPGPPIVRELADGIWFIIREGKTPDGGTYAVTADISQLKTVEADLRRSQDQFVGAVAALQEGFALYDADDRLVLANDEYRRLHPKVGDILKPGMRFEDLVRANIERGVNADAVGREEEHIRERLARHLKPEGAIVRTLADGTKFVIKESLTPDGGVVVTETDITERSRAEEARERLSQAVENVPVGIALFDSDDRLVLFNSRYGELMSVMADKLTPGVPFEEMLRAIVTRQPVQDARGRVEEYIRERMERHRNPTGPYDLRRDDKWLQAHETRMADGSIFVMITDITEQKTAQDALHESERRFKDYAEIASDWFWEMGPDLKFIFHSERYFEITGFRAEDKIGTHRTRYVDPTKPDQEAEQWAAHMADLEARRPFKNFEYTLKVKDGSLRRVRISGTPLFDAGGAFSGYRGIGTDITEQKRVEELLKDAVESIPDGFALYDSDDRLVLFNQNFLKGRPGLEKVLRVGMTFEEQSTLREKIGLRAKHKGTSSIPLKKRIEMHRNPKGPYEATLPDGRTLQVNEFKTRAGGIAIIRTDITQRVRAEENLRRLATAIEGLSENFALYGADDRLIVCNEGYRRLNTEIASATTPGTSFEDHLRAMVENGLAPDAAGREEAWIEERLERHRNPKGPFEMRRQDGIWLLVNDQAMPDGSVATVSTDITVRKEADEALRESEERFRNLVQGSIQGVLIHRDHKPLFANHAYAMIFGFDDPHDILTLDSVLTLFPEDERARLTRYREARLRGDEAPVTYQLRGRKADGTMIWLENQVKVINWKGAPAIQTTTVDITERKQAEELLRESEEKHRLLFENAAAGIGRSRLSDGRVLMANRKLAEMFGYDKVRQFAEEFLFSEHYAVAEERDRMIARYEQDPDRVAEVSFTTRDGSEIIVANQGWVDREAGHIDFVMIDITERRQAEERVIESEERLRGAVESLQEGFALFDEDDRLVIVNEEFRRQNPATRDLLVPGIKFEDLMRANLESGIILDAIGREDAFMRHRIAHHRDPRGPFVRKFNDGTWHMVTESRTADGGIALTRKDITDLKLAEEALRDSEQRFRDVAESAGDWIWEMGPDLRFTYLSQRFYELFQVPMTQIIGKTRDEFAGAPKDDHWRRHLDDIANHRPFRDFEYEVTLPDGRTRHIRIGGKPVFDAEGTFSGYRGTGTDVTVEIEAEAAAAKAAADLVDAIESITAGFALFDADDRLQICNTRYREIDRIVGQIARPGATFEEIVETSIEAGLYHKSMGAPDEVKEARMARHRNLPSSHEQQYADGRWVEVQEYATHDGGTVLLWTDITERKLMSGAKRMEALGKLTGGVAHDFNNLLTVILGNLQLLQRRISDQKQLHRYVELATGAAERGAELTTRLLTFSRRQQLDTAVTDINALVAGMGELLRGTLGETIKIENALTDDLWPVRTDPAQLENALLNLVINSRDAMPDGGTLTIETANIIVDQSDAAHDPDVAPGDYVMVAVSDTGRGMAADVVDHAFEPFFTTKETGKGTGLGLSTVYGFVKQSDGFIKVDSDPGRGTVIMLCLPRHRGAEARPADGGVGINDLVGGDETILVVEDDPNVRQTAVALLSDLGYRVVEAADGPSALSLLDEQPAIDLLFTDIVMPGGMKGPDLASEVRKRLPGMKVLYMSGYAEYGTLGDGMAELDGTLLNKPFQKSELADKIRRTLDG